jgi:hypothetical protein
MERPSNFDEGDRVISGVVAKNAANTRWFDKRGDIDVELLGLLRGHRVRLSHLPDDVFIVASSSSSYVFMYNEADPRIVVCINPEAAAGFVTVLGFEKLPRAPTVGDVVEKVFQVGDDWVTVSVSGSSTSTSTTEPPYVDEDDYG